MSLTLTEAKRLTRLAAKAAQYNVRGLARDFIAQGVSNHALIIENSRGGDSVFDPINDDGDAFRLAVKLSMATGMYISGARAQYAENGAVIEDGDPDPCVNMRLAITKAAVALGEILCRKN
jgi:hypothetical protein